MNVHLRLDGPGSLMMGDCFRCPRRGLQTVRVGSIISPGGPGHSDTEVPLYACRACEQALMAQRAEALLSLVRPYVRAGLHHPH
ncbi:hypothetical protein [Streptomyces sp. NPDC050804]|uniref:hypothetical protein n=1 Tax=Streptomyces sp. NPDC050804 TaxID=3154745 RepID=UPI00342E0342